jgi:hypothetical protein
MTLIIAFLVFAPGCSFGRLLGYVESKENGWTSMQVDGYGKRKSSPKLNVFKALGWLMRIP